MVIASLLICAAVCAPRIDASGGTHFMNASTPAKANTLLMYVGCYNTGKEPGIHCYRLDLGTGALEYLADGPAVRNPSYLAIAPNHKYLYAVNEVDEFEGQPAGSLSAFSIDAQSGALTLLNQKSSRGQGPCHVEIDETGKCALCANYGSGSVAALPIRPDGKLGDATAFVQDTGSGPNRERQAGPHAHSFNISPDNRFALAADLGLDKIFVYRLDAGACTLVPDDPPFARVPPGAGPRHMAFRPDGHYAYVINEMGSTVTAFNYRADDGRMHEIQTVSTLPSDFHGSNTGAAIAVHPNGRFVYASNRGDNSIAIFSVDASTGRLTVVGHQPCGGKTPRDFCVDPTGAYLIVANQDTNNVVEYRIDAGTGRLSATGSQIDVDRPVCVVMMPSG